jgi:hypothetical protein
MEQQGIIEKIPQGQPTEWLSSLAYARKKDCTVRVCLDPRNPNQAIKRTYHRAPTVEEIKHQLAEATCFSKLDAKHGYWSLILDDRAIQSANRFQLSSGKSMAQVQEFGICVSQDIFQEEMDQLTSDCTGVISTKFSPMSSLAERKLFFRLPKLENLRLLLPYPILYKNNKPYLMFEVPTEESHGKLGLKSLSLSIGEPMGAECSLCPYLIELGPETQEKEALFGQAALS